MIQPASPLSQDPVRHPARALLERVYWRDYDIMKHLHPIRNQARKVARSSFNGSGIVAAAIRVEQAGLPEGYRLLETAPDLL